VTASDPRTRPHSPSHPRPVFVVSDSTGITAETQGRALLAHFPGIVFEWTILPFVDTPAKAADALADIAAAGRRAGVPPVLFVTVRHPDVARVVVTAEAEVIDLLGPHLDQLEVALGEPREPTMVPFHAISDLQRYQSRMQAVEYTIQHDDAQSLERLADAQLVIIAPSRCGKTPTAMYLALQHGLRVANYPLTDDDTPGVLPDALKPVLSRCFGLTTTPRRLSEVRSERRPGSTYAGLMTCRRELGDAESLYRRYRIPFLDSHAMSVEEMASVILTRMHLWT
jgi:regulator of PEP synthase PpsR (kinase-PPPase family)